MTRGNGVALDSARVSRAGERVLAIAKFLVGFSTLAARASRIKDCFGATPKPARETRALPLRGAIVDLIF